MGEGAGSGSVPTWRKRGGGPGASGGVVGRWLQPAGSGGHGSVLAAWSKDHAQGGCPVWGDGVWAGPKKREWARPK
jgi:hypothetical protein